MLKSEFLSSLGAALKKNNVSEADDIVGEYEQHFVFKMADGFSEEEIAAKLGSPVALAAQFESASREKGSSRKLLTVVGLCFTDIFVGSLYILLIAWGLVMAALSVACATLTVCLLAKINIHSLIPPMPYTSAIVFAITSAALALIAAIGCFYFVAFVRQSMRSFGRFQRNALAGTAVLPSLPLYPQFTAKTRRWLRTITLWGLTILAISFFVGVIISMIFAGALEFWHTWGWFEPKGL